MKRPEVAHLHEALDFLGFTVGAAEKTDQRYGVATRAAGIEFQTTQKRPATGAVDEATADAINAALADNSVFDPAPDGSKGEASSIGHGSITRARTPYGNDPHVRPAGTKP